MLNLSHLTPTQVSHFKHFPCYMALVFRVSKELFPTICILMTMLTWRQSPQSTSLQYALWGKGKFIADIVNQAYD